MQLLVQALLHYQDGLKQQGFRHLVVLDGDKAWQQKVLQNYLQQLCQLKPEPVLWTFAPENAKGLNEKNFRQYLGQECDGIIYQAEQLNLEPLLAISGCIKAGGLLLVLLPETIKRQSVLWQRFMQFAQQQQALILTPTITPQAVQAQMSLFQACSAVEQTTDSRSLLPCKTLEQQQAVAAILKVAQGHRNRPLVLTADRGRGKTSALALACVALLKQQTQATTIVLTAPSKRAIAGAMALIAEQLAQASWHNNAFIWQLHRIEFVAIDQLVQQKPEAQLVLVDEAASLPIYLLEQLAQHYHRLVFSSTVHGYEGAGRGFSLKFVPQLSGLYPERVLLHLAEPIRWHQNDPLEAFSFALGALNAPLPNISRVNINQVEPCVIGQGQLAQNETLLTQVFALLVGAHYQTSPNDLALLLTHPSIKVFALKAAEQIVAVALVMQEGCLTDFSQQAIAGILQGKRRVKDQFLPQALATQCLLKTAFELSYYRVMRIAVHPVLQHQQLGSRLIQYVIEQGKQQNIDIIGSSFALNTQVFNFWEKNNFNIVNVGLKQDQASGEYSALVLHALSTQAESVQSELNQQFWQMLDYRFTRHYQALSPALIAHLVASIAPSLLPSLSQQQQAQFAHMAEHQLPLDYHAVIISRWLWSQCKKPFCNKLLLAIAKFWQGYDNSRLCVDFGLTGKAEIEQQLYQFFELSLSQSTGD